MFLNNTYTDHLLSGASHHALEDIIDTIPPNEPSSPLLRVHCTLIKNMFLIQDAYEKGFLNYIADYVNNTENEQELLRRFLSDVPRKHQSNTFYFGTYYNEDFFDMQLLRSYGAEAIFSRLKRNVNASDAILSLISSGCSFTDCRASILLARLFTIWDVCIAYHNTENGTKLFNKIFGSKDSHEPHACRLLLSGMGEFSGLRLPSVANKDKTNTKNFPINPIYPFCKSSSHAIDSNGSQTIDIGHIVFFSNHPAYSIKHRGGHSAGFDMISCGSLGYTGLGLKNGKRYLSHEEVLQYLKDAYDKEETYYERMFREGHQLPSPKAFPETIKLSDIPGITGENIRTFSLEALSYLNQTGDNIVIAHRKMILKLMAFIQSSSNQKTCDDPTNQKEPNRQYTPARELQTRNQSDNLQKPDCSSDSSQLSPSLNRIS